jgi:tRNA pseudouridine55 synthase
MGAAGVLPVCLGRATKIAGYIMRGQKEYIAEIVFGYETDTLDSYGKVIDRRNANIGRDAIERIIPDFLGEIMQQPPAFSALKQAGQPLYKLARRGEEILKPPRRTTIYDMRLLTGTRNRFLIKIACSKGTYIRSLIRDMARRLGTVAYMSFLLRTRSCGFLVNGAYTLDELRHDAVRAKALVPIGDALGFMESLTLPGYLFDIVASGAAIDLSRAQLDVAAGKDYVLYCKNKLMGVAACGDAVLKIQTMIYINGADNENTYA